jgi:dCTP deaminase
MILNDRLIKQKAAEGMIEPFVEGLCSRIDTAGFGSAKALSFGTSGYGYDLRLSPVEFFVFNHVPGEIVNPKKFNKDFLKKAELKSSEYGSYFVLPAHSYGLGVAIEKLRVPSNVIVICLGKSTYARLGIILNTTPAEPGWEGHLTLEFSNSSDSDCMIFANEGVCQAIFFEGEQCEVSYADRKGKYQGQKEEVTLGRV